MLAWVIRRTVALSAKYGKFRYITVLAGANFFTFGCTNIPKIAQNGPDLTIWYFIRVSLEFTRLTRLESSQIWIFWVNDLTRVKSWQFSLSQIMTRVKSWPKFFESKFELSQVMGQKNLSAELWFFSFWSFCSKAWLRKQKVANDQVLCSVVEIVRLFFWYFCVLCS